MTSNSNYSSPLENCDNNKLSQTFLLERVTALPSHTPFEIPVIKEFCQIYDDEEFFDPFPHPFKKDALEYMKEQNPDTINRGRYDGPYSQRQLKEMYNNIGFHYQMNSSYWRMIEEEWFRIIKPGGFVIRFGWNSKIMKGFKFVSGLIVYHGGQHNDTIVTVQKKIQEILQ